MVAQQHVHIKYFVSSGGLDGVAAVYYNLGYYIGANSRKKKESCIARFLMQYKISACLC